MKKYNTLVPRYTSYPTLPHWQGITPDKWEFHFTQEMNHKPKGISFYIHVPFCRSLCSFCGCNKKVTNDDSLGRDYIDALNKEFYYYEKMLPQEIELFELHLGGGSPTWLNPDQIKTLIEPILNSPKIKYQKDNLEQSIELDPRTTSKLHCINLPKLGFNRVSLGVQDTNPKVLKAIRRVQPLEMIQAIFENLKQNGVRQINVDLVCGLPLQTISSFEDTIKEMIDLGPSRMAIYNYAHFPEKSPAQKSLEKFRIPSFEEKLALREKAKELLLKAGYFEIGMDHFALGTDPLYLASLEGRLHRNFMGYTVKRSPILIGLGPSSLSDLERAFAQNEKNFETWQNLINKGTSAIKFGHELSARDQVIRQKILELMCVFETIIEEGDVLHPSKIDELIQDNLILRVGNKYKTTQLGRNFIRNICMSLDDYQ